MPGAKPERVLDASDYSTMMRFPFMSGDNPPLVDCQLELLNGAVRNASVGLRVLPTLGGPLCVGITAPAAEGSTDAVALQARGAFRQQFMTWPGLLYDAVFGPVGLNISRFAVTNLSVPPRHEVVVAGAATAEPVGVRFVRVPVTAVTAPVRFFLGFHTLIILG